jgi:hypothetical protein
MGPDDAARVIGLGFPPDRTILPSPDLSPRVSSSVVTGPGSTAAPSTTRSSPSRLRTLGHVLITRDERASLTYERLGIVFELLR